MGGASLVAQLVKNLPAGQETQVQSLGREDPVEKHMANLSSIFAWEIPWIEEPGGLQSMGLQRVWHDWATNTHTDGWEGGWGRGGAGGRSKEGIYVYIGLIQFVVQQKLTL